MKNIYFIIMTVLIGLYIARDVRKKRFSIKDSFWWIVASIIMLVLAIWPHIIDYFAKLLGVYYPPTLLFVFCILFLLFINFKSSKKINELNIKVNDLEQNLTILKGKINEKKQ